MNLQTYTSKLRIAPTNERQSLIDEIYRAFQKRISGGQLAAFIRDKGLKAVSENFEQVQKMEVNDRAGYFVGMCKRERVIFAPSAKTR